MATLYIAEYTETLSEFQRGGGAAQSPTIIEQVVSIGVAANPSSPVGNTTHLIRVHTDTTCSIAITAAGTPATAANSRMAQNQTEYFGVYPGMIISVIENA